MQSRKKTPYIIMAVEKPAGYMLIATAPYAPKTTDYYESVGQTVHGNKLIFRFNNSK